VKPNAILACRETRIAAGRRSSTTSKRAHSGRKSAAHDLQQASDAVSHERPCERQLLMLVKFTSDELAFSATPFALFTVSVEKAAESPVQKSKERAKCGLRSALHNSVGGFCQLLHPLHLAEIRHILSSSFCAVAQDRLHFPHAS
jgi:hypothetical protein